MDYGPSILDWIMGWLRGEFDEAHYATLAAHDWTPQHESYKVAFISLDDDLLCEPQLEPAMLWLGPSRWGSGDQFRLAILYRNNTYHYGSVTHMAIIRYKSSITKHSNWLAVTVNGELPLHLFHR